MDIQQFVNSLREEFDSEMESKVVEAHSEFRALDSWSSMQALIVIARINEDYGVLLSEEDLRKSRTIQDLFNLVQQYKSASIG